MINNLVEFINFMLSSYWYRMTLIRIRIGLNIDNNTIFFYRTSIFIICSYYKNDNILFIWIYKGFISINNLESIYTI